MTFLTIEQLAAQLRAEGETVEQIVHSIRRWKAAPSPPNPALNAQNPPGNG